MATTGPPTRLLPRRPRPTETDLLRQIETKVSATASPTTRIDTTPRRLERLGPTDLEIAQMEEVGDECVCR